MAIIYSYPVLGTAALDDLVLLTDVSAEGRPTKSATVQSLMDAYAETDTLSAVLARGNTATNDIVLTGDFTGTGDITRTGNITLTGAQTISTTLGVTGLSTLATLSVSNNMAVDTDTLFVESVTDRVGIGTTTPASTLELESSTGDIIIELDNNSPNSANLQIKSGAGDARADLILDNNLHLTMKGQRVGIINTHPSHTLDVLGDGRVTTNFIVGGDITCTNIDGVIGSLTPAAGTFTTLIATTIDGVSAEIDNIDGIIGANTPANGTFTTLTATTLGGALDCNNENITNVDIDSGTIDDTVIGGAVPAAGTFTTITGSGDLAIDTRTLFVDVAAGRIGIGTAAPNSTLELQSSGGDIVIEMDNNAAGSSNFQIQCGDGNARADLVLDNNLHITMKGQRVGIINTNPSHTLDVNGDGRIVTNFLVGGNVGIGDTTIVPSVNADLTLEGGAMAIKETTTPTADANYGKIYCKNDNKLYFQDGAGAEHEIQFV